MRKVSMNQNEANLKGKDLRKSVMEKFDSELISAFYNKIILKENNFHIRM